MTAPTMQAPPVEVGNNEIYIVENIGTEPFTWRGFKWGPKTIEPGARETVPFVVLCRYLGDPRARKGTVGRFPDPDGMHPEPGIVMERYDEIKRISILMGLPLNDAAVFDLAPKVRITDINGNVITCPAQDFEAEPHPIAGVVVERDARDQILRMEEEIERLKAGQAEMINDILDAREGRKEVQKAPTGPPVDDLGMGGGFPDL